MNLWRYVWRDIDNERVRYWGIVFWSTGGEIHLGKRLYRWRY